MRVPSRGTAIGVKFPQNGDPRAALGCPVCQAPGRGGRIGACPRRPGTRPDPARARASRFSAEGGAAKRALPSGLPGAALRPEQHLCPSQGSAAPLCMRPAFIVAPLPPCGCSWLFIPLRKQCHISQGGSEGKRLLPAPLSCFSALPRFIPQL